MAFTFARSSTLFSAGLHVLCEKPLTLDPIELQTIIDARDRSERVLALTYIRHYDSGVRRMREEIQSGKWGEVRRTAVYYAEDWLRSNIGTWRHQPDLCPGGVIYDAACHQLDALLWTTGLEPEWAHATIDCCGTEVPIAAWGTGSLAGGVPLTFCLSGDAHIWREQVNVHCDATEFVLDNSHTFQVEDGKLRPIQQDPSRETPDAAFVKHLRSEGPNWAPAEAVRPLMRLSRMILGMDV
jgi:predicted dehydrogenase